MAGFPDEFITLTQLNCVQQCSALLQSPQPRNYLTAATLLGLYCGVLIYRSYRNYLTQQEARITEAQEARLVEVPLYEPYILEEPTVERTELPPLPTPIIEPAVVDQHTTEEALFAAH